MVTKLICVIGVASLFVGCRIGATKSDPQKLSVRDFHVRTITLQDVGMECRVQPLDTTGKYLIGNIADMCRIDSELYLLDNTTNNIAVFNIGSGNVTKLVNKQGSGSGEYIMPIRIKASEDKIYLLDLPTNKIICYDTELNFLEDIHIPVPANDFEITPQGILIYNTNLLDETGFKFYLLNTKGKIIGQYLPLNDYNGAGVHNWGLSRHFFSAPDGSVFLAELFRNKIYRWNHNDIKLQYDIDLGGANIPDNENVNNINVFENEQYACRVNLFVFEDKMVVPFFNRGDRVRYHSFIDLETGTAVSGVMQEENGVPFFPQWQCADQLIGVVDCEMIRENASALTLLSGSTVNLDHVADSDPVLVFYSFI